MFSNSINLSAVGQSTAINNVCLFDLKGRE